MRAAFAYLLVSKGASQHVGEDGERAVSLETFVQAVHQTVEELKGIVLLTEVDSLTPQPADRSKAGQLGHLINMPRQVK